MGYMWVRLLLDRLSGTEPHEASQVLEAARARPGPAVGGHRLPVLTV